MKKVLSIILSALLCVSAISPVIGVFAADAAPIEASSLVTYPADTYTVGEDLIASTDVGTGGGSTLQATVAESSIPADVSASYGVAMNATNEKNVSNLALRSCPERATLKVGKTLTGGQALLVYIKLPATTTSTQLYISTDTDLSTSPNYPRVNPNKPYQLLAQGSTAWEDKLAIKAPDDGAQNGFMELAAGFEGYVKIPLSSMSLDSGVISSSTVLDLISFRVGHFGGTLGSAVVGPLFLVTVDTTALTIKVDGAASAVNMLRPQVAAALEANSLVTYPASSYTVGTDLIASTDVGTGGGSVLKATVAESSISPAVSTSLAVAMNYTNETNLTNAALRSCPGRATLKVGKTLTNGQALLVYIKLPATTTTTQLFISTDTDLNTASANFPRVNSNKPYQLLAQGATAWEQKTAIKAPDDSVDNGFMELDAGFEGYVKIPLDSMSLSGGKITSSTMLNLISFRIGHFGGDLGPATVGPIMLVTKDSTALTIKMDGAATAVDMQKPLPTQPKLEATQILKNTTVAIGEDLVKAGKVKVEPNSKNTATAVKSPVGYSNLPAVSIDNVDGVRMTAATVAGTNDCTTVHVNAKLTDGKSLMFYVKLPDDAANQLFLVMPINPDENGIATSWPRMQNGSDYQLLDKGDTTWTEKQAIAASATTGEENGVIEFDAGFEGYVKIPLSSIAWKSTPTDVTDATTVVSMQMRFSNFGGNYGPITVGPIMNVTSDMDSVEAYVDGSTTASDLFAAPDAGNTDGMVLNFQAFSDSHVDWYSETAVSIGAGKLSQALQDIKANIPKTDALLVGGDLTESGQGFQYGQFFGYFDQFSPTKNVLTVMGNHDIRGNMTTDAAVSYQDMVDRYLPYSSKYIEGQTKPYYDMWIKGYHFIMLSTDEKLKDASKLSDEQMTWFEAKVKESVNSQKPIFVMTHDPLQDTFSGSDAENSTQPSDRIKAILKKYPQIVLFTGHEHAIVNDKVIISKGEGILVNMPSLHNSNRPQYPNDENNTFYYNVKVYADRVDILLHNFKTNTDAVSYSIKTTDFAKAAEPVPVVVEPVMKVKPVTVLQNAQVGDTVANNNVIVHYAAGETGKITMTAGAPLTAMDTAPSLKIDSDAKIVRKGIESQTQLDISLHGASTDGGKAMLLYVKLPTVDDGSGKNLIFFNVCNTDTGDGDAKWSRFAAGTLVKYLQKGTNKWESVSLQNYGEVSLPAGFEGYIYAPFADIVNDANFLGLEDGRAIRHIGLSIGYFGGEYGPAYVAPVLMASNTTLSKDGAILNGETIIRNLFTGAEMQEGNVVEDANAAPAVGTVVTDLPTPSTDKIANEIADADVTNSTVTLSWQALDGASKYRVDIYKSSYGIAGLEYVYSGNKIVSDTSCTIDGLLPSTHYYFVVVGLDSNNVILAYYDSVSVLTLSASEGGSAVSDSSEQGQGANNNNESPNTGVAFPALATAGVMVSAVVVAGSNRRKKAK